ncbi:MAG: DEAD/DEAH box helicase, partial [Cyclobacteriaceae bacterium]
MNMTRQEFKRGITTFVKNISPAKVRARAPGLASSIEESTFDFDNKTAEYKIRGTHLYKIDIKIQSGYKNFVVRCECPYGFGCKHSVAALQHLGDYFPLEVEEVGRPQESLVPVKKSRSSKDPYIVANFKKLSYAQFSRHTTPSSRNTYGISIREAGYRNDGLMAFKVGEDVGVWYQNSYEEQLFTVQVQVKDDDLNITCTCARSVTKLCRHGYAVLMYCYDDWGILESLDKGQLDQLGSQMMHQYGLPESADWPTYFEVVRKGAGVHFVPNALHADLVVPDSLNEEVIDQVTSWSPPSVLTMNPAKEQVPGFIFYTDRYDQLCIGIILGSANKDNRGIQKSLDSFEESDLGVVATWSDGEKLIARLSAELDYAADEEISEMAYSLLSDSYNDLLSLPNLYTTDLGHINHIRRRDLRPVQFSDVLPELLVRLSENDEFVHTNNFVSFQGLEVALPTEEISILGRVLMMYQDQLYLIDPQKAEAFDLFSSNKPKVTKPNFPAFFDKYLVKLGKKYELDFSNMSSFILVSQSKKLLQKEIYLSELNDFIIIRPIIKYEGELSSNPLVNTNQYLREEETYVKAQLDDEAEKSFVEQLKSLHESFQTQNSKDYLYLTFDAFIKDNWFFEAFRFFKEIDCQVYGWTDLKKFKYNPNPPQVNLSIASGEDWFEAQGNVAYGDTIIGLEELQKAMINKSEFIQLGDGTLGLLPQEWIDRMEKLFRHGEMNDGALRVSDKLFSLVDEFFDLIDDEATLQKLNEKKEKLLAFEKIESRVVPSDVNATLRPYQVDGFNWLCFLDEFQWGGILADDMGLGKTLQVLTFLTHVTKENEQTNLLVVPTSLLFNWQNEIEKFNPKLSYIIHHGTGRDRSLAEFEDAQLVFTTYGTLVSDIEVLKKQTFNYVILDESQAIKNPTSKRYKAACVVPARNRLAMTGTPIENNTFDLFAQMNFLNRGLLGNMTNFKKLYATAIDKHKDQDRAADLQKIINPFVLRRTKEQVATELPDKVEDVIYCEMESAQRKVYDAYRNYYRDKIIGKIAKDGLNQSRFSVLEGLTKLRQVCDTPQLIKDENYKATSAKMKELLQHIKEKTNNHKLLVFSQFVQMLKLIEHELVEQGIKYEYLDGQSKPEERQKSVEHFQTEEE